jgi:hypothetical protein
LFVAYCFDCELTVKYAIYHFLPLFLAGIGIGDLALMLTAGKSILFVLGSRRDLGAMRLGISQECEPGGKLDDVLFKVLELLDGRRLHSLPCIVRRTGVCPG